MSRLRNTIAGQNEGNLSKTNKLCFLCID